MAALDFRLFGVVYGQVRTLNNKIESYEILLSKGFLGSHGYGHMGPPLWLGNHFVLNGRSFDDTLCIHL